MHLLAEYGGHDSFLGQRVKNQPLQGTMRHGPSGCQGVPDRPEIREAATTLRVQCETLDQPAALAAYLNRHFYFSMIHKHGFRSRLPHLIPGSGDTMRCITIFTASLVGPFFGPLILASAQVAKESREAPTA